MQNRTVVRSIAALVGIALIVAGVWLHLHRDRSGPTGLAALSAPAGFKIERAAGSDLVAYPMMATFDDRGRLFICESSGNTLNNAQMAANPDYKIRLLEDKNADGVFDTSKVFAEKLTLPCRCRLVPQQPLCSISARPDSLRGHERRRRRGCERSRSHRMEDVGECSKPARADPRTGWLALSHRWPPWLRHQHKRWAAL